MQLHFDKPGSPVGIALPLTRNLQSELARINETIELDLVKARADVCELGRRYRNCVEISLLHARICLIQRDPEDAIRVLEAARAIQPQNPVIHFRFAMAYRLTGDLNMALKHLIVSARYSSRRDTTPVLMMAFYYHRTGQPDRAIPVFRRLENQRNGDPAALLGLTLALRETGQFSEADAVVRRLSNACETSVEARYRVLQICQGHDFHGWLELDDKVFLKKHVDSMRKSYGPDAFDHLPETYVMPEEYSAFEAAHRERPRVWLVKPNNLHNGHGQKLIDTPENVPRRAGWLVQEYITNPLLFLGRKVSFRVMIVITAADPMRVYLFDGGSCRFAEMPYEGHSRDTWDRLAMHVGHMARFRDQKELLEETTRVTGNDHHVWNWRQMSDYIAAQGHDPDLLWSRVRRLAQDVIKLIEYVGVLRQLNADGRRFAYGPKIIGLDIQIDETMKPWLLEIEKRPSYRRMFDGHRENNPVFRDLLRMTFFPLMDSDRDVQVQERELRNYEYCATRIADIEVERCGRFIPIRAGGG